MDEKVKSPAVAPIAIPVAEEVNGGAEGPALEDDDDKTPTEERTEELGSPNGAAALVIDADAATTTDNNTVTIQVRSSGSTGNDLTDSGGAKGASKISGTSAAVTRIEINGSNIRESMEADRENAVTRSQSRLGAEEDEDDDDDGSGSDISSVINAPSVISQTPDRYGFLGGEQYTHERYESINFTIIAQ